MIGFIGIGVMGSPMALNLARSGTPLVVWNRSAEKCEPLRAAGALVAESAAEIFARSEIVLLMLSGAPAIDSVLARGTTQFATRVAGRTIVNMSTCAPGYARDLALDIITTGGDYVESPVSGSKKPAEDGALVAMLAGTPQALERVRPLLAPMCRTTIACGNVPNGLLMKQSVNLFLITMVTGLAEAAHYAGRLGLPLRTFADVLAAGPMASAVSGIKADKLVERDFSVQASVGDVLNNNTQLIVDEARASGTATPLLAAAHELFRETSALGYDTADMTAVVYAIESRSSERGGP